MTTKNRIPRGPKPPAAGTKRSRVEIDADAQLKLETDRQDPDNYFVVPKFGMTPAAVSFRGFARPIVTPSNADDFAHSVRGMVRTLRRLARAEFETLEDLRRCFMSRPNTGFPYTDLGKFNFTAPQEAAIRYSVAMECLQRAHAAWTEDRPKLKDTPGPKDTVSRDGLSFYATASSLVLGWIERRPLAHDLRAFARLKKRAQEAGRRSGKARRQSSKVANDAALRKLCERRDELLQVHKKDPREAAGILAKESRRPDGKPYSTGYIRKLLKKCATEG